MNRVRVCAFRVANHAPNKPVRDCSLLVRISLTSAIKDFIAPIMKPSNIRNNIGGTK
jgi:hypothetical protein